MQLNAKRYGDAGPPLLILHGLFGSLSNWNWHSRQLGERFTVYALDLRNHGGSPHHELMDYPAMAGDVLRFMDDHGIAEACILGHSMGGKVAMQLALSHPERVRCLLVADIAPVDYSAARAAKEGHEEIFQALESIDPRTVSSREEADHGMAGLIPNEAVRKFLLANLVKSGPGGFRWRFNLPALKQNYDALRAKPVGTTPFDKPTLFIKGADSHYIGEEHRDAIMALFPRAELKIIMGAGHWLHADKPPTFNKVVSDFLDREAP
ncbi:MAG: hypothetical protein RLZZ385_1511 [Pseudomonadota bacterium]|jgi:esterase